MGVLNGWVGEVKENWRFNVIAPLYKGKKRTVSSLLTGWKNLSGVLGNRVQRMIEGLTDNEQEGFNHGEGLYRSEL